MKHLGNLISYFCEYEVYNNLLSNAIDKKKAVDVVLKDCSFDFILAKMMERKCEKIAFGLKSRLSSENPEKSKASIRDYVEGKISLDALFEMLPFKNLKYLGEPKANVKEIYCEQHFCVYYPVILNRKKRSQQPMLSFSCMLLSDSFVINKVYANKEAFVLLIAQHKEIEVADARSLYEDQLDKLASAVDALHESNNLQDTYRVVCAEFERISGINPNNFRSTEEWQMLEKAIISFEPFNSIVDSRFREEMDCLIRFYKENAVVPQTLKQYLGFSQNDAKNVSGMKFSDSHIGSYQSGYPVNKKQWELVQLAEAANLLCVEGPPGTGKTTLLKEMIADTIVRKADKLIEIWEGDWENIGGKSKVINRSPMGGENLNSIVISSANGKAIDNIGLELLREIPYFKAVAEKVKVTKDTNAYCEGILCARLGKSENVDFFYYSVFMPFCKYLNAYEITEDEITLAKKNYNDLRKKLDQINVSISRFISLQGKERKIVSIFAITEKISQIASEQERLENIRRQIKNEKTEHENMRRRISADVSFKEKEMLQKNESLKVIEYGKRALYSDLKKYENIGAGKKALRFLFPGANKLLQKYGSAQQIRDMIQESNRGEKNCQTAINEMAETLTGLKQQLTETEEAIAACSKVITETDDKFRDMSSKKSRRTDFLNRIVELARQIGCSADSILGLNAYELNNIDNIINLRHDIFAAAIRLTEVYIHCNKKPILQNLALILEKVDYVTWCRTLYNGDKAYESGKAACVRALWETFFLCFPVITTTLHSLRRNIFPLIPDLFDKLMIDESGQVIPYYVVAPLYRARRAIFVGDVNQIEPIKSVPARMLEKKYTEILGETTYTKFCIDTASAQSFAVQASDYCEYTENERSGVVLNEHRRCEPAIMAFSNLHIYHNVLELKGQNDCNKLFKSNLIAFDIRGVKAAQHYNRSEIDACKNIVDLFVEKYGEGVKKKIGIITPFSQQAAQLSKAITDVETGTVHVFQGAEKEYIIFSCVIDDKSVEGGLVRFIGAKGNLLNVAFSRAKKQFIFVGNLRAAKSAENYLKFAVETIESSGKIFSLFSTGDDETQPDTDAIGVLTGNRTVYEKDAIFNYFQEIIPQNIIDTPKLHNEILLSALQLATQSVYIISPWISDNVVDENMIDIIKERLNQNISINIIFGYKATQCSLSNIDELVAHEVLWGQENSANAIGILKNLLGDKLKYSPPSHAKLLLIDDKYLFIGSLNWLFNSGKTKQKEISCLITDRDTISYVKSAFL